MEDHAGEGAGAPRGVCLSACFQDGLQDWAWLTGCLHDGVSSSAWLTCCFGELGVGTRPGNAGALAGPWGQMRRRDLAGCVQVTCCLEGRLRHGGSCRRGRRRSQGCVAAWGFRRWCSRLACVVACLHDGLHDWARLTCCFGDGTPRGCVPERSSQAWVHNGAPWKREARTIGTTSRPGAQMPIGAWDHRFHGEGERQ